MPTVHLVFYSQCRFLTNNTLLPVKLEIKKKVFMHIMTYF